MCGIVGVLSRSERPGSAATIERMHGKVAHRGPDDEGFASLDMTDGRIITSNRALASRLQLGFRRLAIRDLSHRGHQPMVSDDGKCVILFNGEIYNTASLKKDYLSGQKFRSTSDTEVVLKVYQAVGIERLALLMDGIFAIAIYDSNDETLYLVRDRFGVKPLYYAESGPTVLFASEIKPIISSGVFKKELDPDCLSELSLFRYVSEPLTPFKGVMSLEPGSIARVTSSGGISMARYWKPLYQTQRLREGGYADSALRQLDGVIESTIDAQLVSDVRVGLQLSGGIDSSLLAKATAAKGVAAYSVIPTASELSEEKYVDIVCQSLGMEVNKLTLDPDAIGHALGRIAYYHETPINHEGSIGIYLVCQLAREHGTKVLLSGEGADELFAGYQRYRIMNRHFDRARAIARWLPTEHGWLPRRINTAIDLWSNREQRLVLASAYGTPGFMGAIFPGFSLDEAIRRRLKLLDGFDWRYLHQNHLIFDQQTYLVDLLVRQDKLSMAHSVEVRVPFLSNAVAEYANTLPYKYKMTRSGEGKRLLRKLADTAFGPDLAYRKKWGFSLPISFFDGDPVVKSLMQACVTGMENHGLITRAAARDVQARAAKGDGYAIRASWIMFSMALWYDIYFQGGERSGQFVDLPGKVD